MTTIGDRKGLLLTDFIPFRQARVKGHVPSNATRFDINVRSDPFIPHTPVPLHLAFHVKDGKLKVNYFYNGWSSYHTEFPNLPIKPGNDFEVVIQCKYDYFKICIGGIFFCCFKHHLSPDIIKCIDANTDVVIKSMAIEGSPYYR